MEKKRREPYNDQNICKNYNMELYELFKNEKYDNLKNLGVAKTVNGMYCINKDSVKICGYLIKANNSNYVIELCNIINDLNDFDIFIKFNSFDENNDFKTFLNDIDKNYEVTFYKTNEERECNIFDNIIDFEFVKVNLSTGEKIYCNNINEYLSKENKDFFYK